MKKTIEETTRLLLQGTIPKDEADKILFILSNVSGSVLEQIRQAFANYRKAEGCSCCRDNDAHEEAEKRLAELLKPKPYDDGSGFDWWQYCTER